VRWRNKIQVFEQTKIIGTPILFIPLVYDLKKATQMSSLFLFIYM